MCTKVISSENKCKNDIEVNFQIFAAENGQEEFVIEFTEKIGLGKSFKQVKKTEDTPNGLFSINMLFKIH